MYDDAPPSRHLLFLESHSCGIDLLIRAVSSPTTGIFLLSNSFNTHAHLSSAKMYVYEINENIRIILYLSYIIADFLRNLFKRLEDVN